MGVNMTLRRKYQHEEAAKMGDDDDTKIVWHRWAIAGQMKGCAGEL